MELEILCPEEAQKALKTNRPLKKGEMFKGPDQVAMKRLAAKHPDAFKLHDPEGEKLQKKIDEKKSSYKPDSNKKMRKGTGFKSK